MHKKNIQNLIVTVGGKQGRAGSWATFSLQKLTETSDNGSGCPDRIQ